MYLNGIGVQQSYEEAMYLFKLAADHEHAEAQCNVETMYQNGQGILRNRLEALKWHKIAAKNQSASAQYLLGERCLDEDQEDKESDRNPKEAINWYKLSADQDCVDAQYKLGEMYFKGIGVTASLDIALEWLEKAFRNTTVTINDK
jgi:TPR repeat protein